MAEIIYAEGMNAVADERDRVSMSKRVALESMAELFIEMMRAGVVPPWAKSWRTIPRPRNVEGRPYSGINRLFLEIITDFWDYQSPYWTTRGWVEKRGGIVPKDARSVEVIAIFRVKDRQTGEDSNALAATGYVVYNVEEIFKEVPRWEPEPLDERRFAKARRIVDSYLRNRDNLGPTLEYDSFIRSPSYYPGWDKIVMPRRGLFDTNDEFYHSLFHEMTHSTGHETRLNRRGVTRYDHFGSHQYGEEELVAGMTAAMLARETGIDSAPGELNSAAYLQSWLGSMEESPEMLVSAIDESERALRYLLKMAEPPSKAPDTERN